MTSKNKQVALDQEIRYHLPLLGSFLQALGKEVVATDAMVEEEVDIITIVHNLLQILPTNGETTEVILTEVQDDTIEETEIAAALADEIQIEVHMEIVGIEIEAIEKRADMMIPFLEICSDPKSKAPRG